MLIDARVLPQDHIVSTDLCIVGAGPAGLTIARELAGTNLRVTIVDSGAEDPRSTPAEVREQIKGEVHGDGYPALEAVHSQGFGGTTSMWDFEADGLTHAVRLRRLERADFEKRSWVPHSGWPFSYDEIEPYYVRAEEACRIGSFRSDITGEDAAAAGLPMVAGDLSASEYRFVSADEFVSSHRRTMEQSGHIEVIINGTVTELDTFDDPGTVRRVRVQTSVEHGLFVQARWVVLAAGGIDNARLLLLSDQVHQEGIGNQHGVVGRYFMDHPGAFGAHLVLENPSVVTSMTGFDTVVENGIGRLLSLTLKPSVIEREQLMHSFAVVQPRVSERYRRAVSAVRDVSRLLQPGTASCEARPAPWTLVGDIARGVPPLVLAARTGTRAMRVRPGWSRRSLNDSLYSATEMQLLFALEQAPNPDSRLSLGTERDRLGQRLSRLDYRWSRIDVDSATRTREIMSKELSNASIGNVVVDAGRGFPDPSERSKPHHPTGSTRMHRNPREGVVDADGRVHGVSNLSVVGSSTFPTGGSANPTLTIVALAIRMADHLRRTLT